MKPHFLVKHQFSFDPLMMFSSSCAVKTGQFPVIMEYLHSKLRGEYCLQIHIHNLHSPISRPPLMSTCSLPSNVSINGPRCSVHMGAVKVFIKHTDLGTLQRNFLINPPLSQSTFRTRRPRTKGGRGGGSVDQGRKNN